MTNTAPTAPTTPIRFAVRNPGQAWTYVVPEFTDDDGDGLTYSATLGDGTALPAWLTFNAENRTFSIAENAASVAGTYALKVTATDDNSAGALATEVTFSLIVAGTDTVFLDAPGSTPDKTVKLDSDGTPNELDTAAMGTLIIADSDGLSSVTASGARFGSITIGDEDANNPGHYDWSYTLDETNNPELARLHGQSIVEVITITATDMNGTAATHELEIAASGTGANSHSDASRIDDTVIKDGGGQATLILHGVEFKVGAKTINGNNIWIDVVTRDDMGRPYGAGMPAGNADIVPRDDNGYDFRFTPDAMITPGELERIWENYAGTGKNTIKARTDRITAEIVDSDLEAIPVQALLGRYWLHGGAESGDRYALEDKTLKLDHTNSGNNNLSADGRLIITDADGFTSNNRVTFSYTSAEGVVTSFTNVKNIPQTAPYGTFAVIRSGNNYIWRYKLKPDLDAVYELAAGTHHQIITFTITDDDDNVTIHHLRVPITIVGSPPDRPTVFTEVAPNPAEVTIKGVRFAETRPGSAGDRQIIEIKATTNDDVTSPADRYKIFLGASDGTLGTSDRLKDLWDNHGPKAADRKKVITATVVDAMKVETEDNVSIIDFQGVSDLTAPPAPTITINRDDSTENNLMTTGRLTITDADGLTSPTVTASAGVYGMFGITRDTTDTDNWNWEYTLDPDDTDTAALTGNETETIRITVVDDDGHTQHHDLMILVAIKNDTDFTEGVNSGREGIIFHGVRFTAVATGHRGVQFDVAAGVFSIKDSTTTWTWRLPNTKSYTPADILAFWEGRDDAGDLHTRNNTITAEIITGLNAGVASVASIARNYTFHGGSTGGENDKAVTLDYANAFNTDLLASGSITITDENGITASNVSVSDPTYGLFTFTKDTTNTDKWNWDYILNPGDPQTAALAEGTATETITITTIDDDGYIDTHDLDITITVTGTATWLGSTDTNFNGGGGSVTLDRGDANNTLMATGTVTITDRNGVGSVSHNGAMAQYGTFSFDEATGGWSYTLDPTDDDTIALTDSDMETIRFTVVDEATSPNTATHDLVIDVNIIANAIPTATPTGISLAADADTYTFTDGDFVFADGNMGDSLASVTIVSLPTTGSLALDGVAVTAGDEIAIADIMAMKLVYTPGPDRMAAGTDSFTYTVSDGKDDSTPAATMDITVAMVVDSTATFTESGHSGQAALVINGVVFTINEAGADGNDYAIKVGITTVGTDRNVGTEGMTYTFKLHGDIVHQRLNEMNVFDNDLLTAWGRGGSQSERAARNSKIKREVIDTFTLENISAEDLAQLNAAGNPTAKYQFTGGAAAGEGPVDKQVSLDQLGEIEGAKIAFDDYDLLARGGITIADTNGISRGTITATDAAYGRFTIEADSGTEGKYNWLYVLNPQDAELIALTDDTTETITLTFTDNAGYTATHDIAITIDISTEPQPQPIPVAIARAGEAWSYQIPAFTDPESDAITYTATLADGAALPGWLVFNADANSRTFAITAGATSASLAGVYEIKITATDAEKSNDAIFFLVIPGAETIFLEDPTATEDRSVTLDTDGDATDTTDTEASGRVVITDADGLASVTGSGRFGSVVIAEDSTTPGTYDWTYTLDTGGNAELARLHNQSIVEIITITATDMNGNSATYDLVIEASGTGGDASRLDDAVIKDGDGHATAVIHGVQFEVVPTVLSGNNIWVDFITRDDNGNPFEINAVRRGGKGYDFQFTPDAIVTPEILKITWDNAHRSNPPDDRAATRVGRVKSEVVDANLEGVPVRELLGRYWFQGGAESGDHYGDEDKDVALNYTTSTHDLAAAGRLIITDADTIASVVASQARYGDFVLAAPAGDNYLWTYTLNPRDADTNALAAGEWHEVITITITDDDGAITTHDLALNITITGEAPDPTIDPQSVALGEAWTSDEIDAFADTQGTTTTYAATLANGDDLPMWLTFDETARTFAIAEDATDADDEGQYEIRVTASRNNAPVDSATFYLAVGNIATAFEEVPAADAASIVDIHGVRFTFKKAAPNGATAKFIYVRADDSADIVELIDNRYYEIRLQGAEHTPADLEEDWRTSSGGTGTKSQRLERISADIIDENLGSVAREDLYGTYYFAPDLGDRRVAFNHDNGMHDTAASGILAISDVNGGVASYRAVAKYGTVVVTADSTTAGNYNWEYILSTDSRQLQALEPQRLQDTITFIVTDGDGHTATHDVVVDLNIINTPTPADTATVFEELAGDGTRFVMIHGVRFIETSPNSAGDRDSIFFSNDTESSVVLTKNDNAAQMGRYTLSIFKNPSTSQQLAELWNTNGENAATRKAKITAEAILSLSFPPGSVTKKTYDLVAPPESDTELEIDYDNDTTDLMANGTLFIIDANGVMASNVTASAGVYGTFTITQDSTTATNYNWQYMLNANDPDTAALGRGTHTETITITVTDNAGYTATHELAIAFDVVGDVPHRANANTSIRETVNATPPKAVTLNYTDTSMNAFTTTGTLTITDTDGVASVAHNGDTATQYGVFAFDEATGAWTYTLNPNDPQTAALAEGTSYTETIRFTVTDVAGSTPATHDLVINVNVVGTASWLGAADTNFRETIDVGLPGVIVHGVRFDWIADEAIPDGFHIDFKTHSDPTKISVRDDNGAHYHFNVDNNVDDFTPMKFRDLWNENTGDSNETPAQRMEKITATLLDNSLTPLTPTQVKDDLGEQAFAPLASVLLNYNTGNDSLKTSGTLTITDTDGVASVSHNGAMAQYGTFSFDEATGAWHYTLDATDADTLALTANAMETITFKVIDETAGTPVTMMRDLVIAINVVGTNAAPTAMAQQGITLDEDATLIFTGAHFGFTDTDSGDVLSSITITGLPSAGVLMLVDPETGTSTALTAGNLATLGVIDAADIGDLTYTPGDSFAANGTATFTYRVNDGRVNSAADATITLNIEADDDLATEIVLGGPVTGLLADADTTSAMKLADITPTDADGGNGGTLQLAGADVALFEIADHDGDGGQDLRLKAGAVLTAGTVAVTIRLVENNSVSADYTLTITQPNAAPTATAEDVTVSEDATHTFDADNFGFDDADTGDALVSITITGLPTAGTLILDGTVLTAGNLAAMGVITEANIGKLVYAPPSTFTTNTPVTFTYTVSDGKASSSPATMEITVEADDDMATDITLTRDAAADTLTVDTDTTSAIKVADIAVTDADRMSPGMLEPAGADAALFEIVDDGAGGFDLNLIAGAMLTAGELVVIVRLKDTSVMAVFRATVEGTAGTEPIPENMEVPTDQVVYMPEASAGATYALKDGDDDDADLFDINPTNGEVTFIAATTPDFEKKPAYTFTVITTINGVATEGEPITLGVANVDERATGIVLFGQTASLKANADTSTAIKVADIIPVRDPDGKSPGTLELAGADAARFEIVGRELRLKAGESLSADETLMVTIRLEEDNDVSVDYSLNVERAITNATSFEEGDPAGDTASVLIQGVRFTAADAGADGNDFSIVIAGVNDGVSRIATNGDRFTINLLNANTDVTPQELVNLWEGRDEQGMLIEAEAHPRNAKIRAIIEDMTPDMASATDLAETYTLTGGGENAPDKAVAINYTDDTEDVAASGVLNISDIDGISSVTGSAGIYGVFAITADDTIEDRYNWTYTLNPDDPHTAALDEQGAEEVITITATDKAGNEASYDVTIDVDITGQAGWLVLDITEIRPESDDPKAVRLNHDDESMNMLAANGTLTITDTDGVASVEHTGDAAMYGVFSFDEATGAWEYRLNPNDPDTAALTAGTHMETIRFTATDREGEETQHPLTINITIVGADSRLGTGSDITFIEANDPGPMDGPAKTTVLDTTDASKHVLETSGTLIVTNADGVTHNGAAAMYGSFSFDEATGAWEYMLNLDDPDTSALTEVRMLTETIRFTATNNTGTETTYDLVITVNVVASNARPTATPTGVTVAEDAIHTFALADFGFMDGDNDDADPANDDALVSVTITGLPGAEAGVLTLNGVAVSVGQVVSVAQIQGGRLMFEPVGDKTAGFNTSLTYTLTDGKIDSTEATLAITIEADDDAPVLQVRETIGIEANVGHILTRHQVGVLDLDTAGADDTSDAVFTLTAITGGKVQTLDTTDGTWGDVTPSTATPPDAAATFTQAQIDDGHVRLVATEAGSLTVTAAYGGATFPAQTLRFVVREEEDIKGIEVGAAGDDGTLDLRDEAESKTITTGLGDTTIRPGRGDDKVDPGLGDDEVDLSAGGDDLVIYRYETDGMGNTIAWGGGDDITGFTPGQDRLVLDKVGGGSGSFLDGLGSGFVVTLATAYTGGDSGTGSRDSIASYNVEGVEIHFSQAVLLPGGILGGAVLSITFQTPFAWDDFNTMWLGGEAGTESDDPFNTDSLTFNDNTAGEAALMRILGLDATSTGRPSVAVGDDGDNIISTAGEDGAWLIFGGAGDDAITLGGGLEKLVYRLGYDRAGATDGGTGSANNRGITNPDGSDVINDFALGTDKLAFVDTDGEPAALADLLLQGFEKVSLTYADGEYEGIIFEIISDDAATDGVDEEVTLTLNFAEAEDKAALADRFGLANDGAALDGLFEAGAQPLSAGGAASGTPIEAELSIVGVALLNDFFGGENIIITDSLQAELL